MTAEKFQRKGVEMDGSISEKTLDDLVGRTQLLMRREPGKTAHDAIPQVLNGAGFNGKSESDRRKRRVYARKLRQVFNRQTAT